MTRRVNRVAPASAEHLQTGSTSNADTAHGVPQERADAGARTPGPEFATGQTTASGEGWTLRLGDCLSGLRSLPDASIDAVVTDPPAGIGFMGREWDSDKGGRDHWIAWLTSVMAECLRVLKPGGHAVVWALPRTSHWTATAIEDARFEIRDVHHHIFGTGFPKSLNVSSVMHELLGVTDGEYGTALKPAVEHWILARKPLVGTYAENIRSHGGAGALNIGACRASGGKHVPSSRSTSGGYTGGSVGVVPDGVYSSGYDPSVGRWPAHLSLDEYAAALLDEMSGECPSAGSTAAKSDRKTEDRRGFEMQQGKLYPERTGGASRFFYVAKGSRAEKDRGLEGLRRASGAEVAGRKIDSAGMNSPRAGVAKGARKNIHPTVKSIELMRWLVRLVTPMPGSLVLDPFAGSGTTGLGALAEGHRFLGFELGEDYAEIARARLDAATRQQTLPVLVARPAEVAKAEEQPSLFDLLFGVGA